MSPWTSFLLVFTCLCASTSDTANTTKIERSDFQSRLREIRIDGLISAAIAVGNRLKLFDALARAGNEKSPASAADVAKEANCKERYVKEWLAAMATGDIISVTKDEKFFIEEDRVEELTNGAEIILHSFLPNSLRPYDKLCEVMKNGGPYGLAYSDYGDDFFEVMGNAKKALYKKRIIVDFLPAVGWDIMDRLKKGGMTCLDVGCGRGIHSALFAEKFPKSNFTGIDITQDAIRLAKEQRKENGQAFDNLDFIQMDCSEMDKDWSNKYDFVTIFNAAHDQMRPDLCLKQIYRVLKPGGIFAMSEIKGTSNIYKDKQEIGDIAASEYAISLFHCLPVGSNSKDALGLGAMWGKERAVKLIKEAGFKNVSVIPTPYFETSILYVTKKE